MGKASSSKKVARAAKAGGGPSRRQGNTSWSFYGTLAGITAVGMVLLGVSLRGSNAEAVPPTLRDHWHAAYGIYICNTYLPPINGEGMPDITGIHAHADGLIHVHPFTSAVTGNRATLEKFEEAIELDLRENSIELPDGTKYENGDTCKVDGKDVKGTVKYFTYTKRVAEGYDAERLDKAEQLLGSPDNIRLYQNQILTFAFVPDGVVPPVPPSELALASPSDLIAPTTTVAGATSTTAAGATTVAGATTTAPAGATTTAPAGATTTGPTTTGPTTTGPTTTGPTTTAG